MKTVKLSLYFMDANGNCEDAVEGFEMALCDALSLTTMTIDRMCCDDVVELLNGTPTAEIEFDGENMSATYHAYGCENTDLVKSIFYTIFTKSLGKIAMSISDLID